MKFKKGQEIYYISERYGKKVYGIFSHYTRGRVWAYFSGKDIATCVNIKAAMPAVINLTERYKELLGEV